MSMFGTREVTTDRASGEFHCPECRALRAYRLRRRQRFFHVFWIPLIPVGEQTEFVECLTCGATFAPSVLEGSAEAAAEEEAFWEMFREGLRLIVIHMIAADGVIEDDEIELGRKILSHMSEIELSSAEIRQQAEQLAVSQRDALTVLAAFGTACPPGVKEHLVRAALLLAAVDGEIAEGEAALVMQVGAALGLTDAHMRGLIETFGDTGTETVSAAPPPSPVA